LTKYLKKAIITIAMQRLHPKAVWIFFLQGSTAAGLLSLFTALFVVGLVMYLGLQEKPTFEIFRIIGIISAFLVIFSLAINYLWAKLEYHFYRYEISDDGFRKESGVISKHYVTIPYEKIQNVDIYRGIFHRILGLSDLHIQTAGLHTYTAPNGTSEGNLPGLDLKTAQEIRTKLIKRAQQFKN
jgi:uncharacterized membrane protein YdbT with pleckstrin-like domain